MFFTVFLKTLYHTEPHSVSGRGDVEIRIQVLGSSISKDALSSCEPIDVKGHVIGTLPLSPRAIWRLSLPTRANESSSTRHVPADSSMTPSLTWMLSLSTSRRVGEGRTSGDSQAREGRDVKKNPEKAESSSVRPSRRIWRPIKGWNPRTDRNEPERVLGFGESLSPRPSSHRRCPGCACGCRLSPSPAASCFPVSLSSLCRPPSRSSL